MWVHPHPHTFGAVLPLFLKKKGRADLQPNDIGDYKKHKNFAAFA